MPYITKSSLNRIFVRIQAEQVPDHLLDSIGKIWPRSISQFSWLETKSLLVWKLIYKSPTAIVDIYKKSDKQDSFTYLDEATSSSYHKLDNCPYLNSGFITYKIPKYIQRRGPNEVKSFRAWYKNNISRLGGIDAIGNHQPIFYQEMAQIFGKPLEAEEAIKLEDENVPNIDEPRKKENIDLNQLRARIENLRWSSKNRQCEVLPSTAHARQNTSERPAADPQEIYTSF